VRGRPSCSIRQKPACRRLFCATNGIEWKHWFIVWCMAPTAGAIRIRKETGWGYTKIVQAMRRLGHKISRQTVKNVLVEAGLGPEPHDHPDTWSEFLKRHAETMWQCDFACKRKWTVKGMVDLYFLVFIHLGTRRIWVSPCTANPSGDWTAQQARNFDMFLQDENLPCTIRQRDQDTKYVQAFDDVFRGDGRTIKKTPIQSPNLQSFVERVIQKLKHEVLNGLCIVILHCQRAALGSYPENRGRLVQQTTRTYRSGPPAASARK
jgi:hypothetical protein